MQNKTKGTDKEKSTAKKRKKSRRCWWAAPVISLSVVVLVVAGLFISQQIGIYRHYLAMRTVVDQPTYYTGIYLDGISLANATQEQAIEHWRENIEPSYANRTVTVNVQGRTYTFTAADFGYTSNYEEVLDQAFSIGRSGTLEERYREIQQMANNSRDVFTDRTIVNAALVEERLDEIVQDIDTGASSARVTGFNAETKEFTFAEGVAGYAVNAAQLKNDVLKAFSTGENLVVEAQVDLVQPTTTVAEISEKYGLIDSATTNASSSSSNRLSNIQLACSTIHGYCLEPGATFSFNEVVGKRTKERGYKEAPAYINGLVEDDVGGGICQVSTTLFNAVVKADMTITERSAHSRPVSYVDYGKDAAVNWPDTDLKFTNESSDPIYIVAEVTENKRVVISVYGRQFDDGGSIVVEAKTIETLEPGNPEYRQNASLLPGEFLVVQDAREGYKAEAYKIYLDADGNEVDRELLCKTTYRASGGIIEFGP